MPYAENILEWNTTNWVTVVLMLVLFYAGAGMVMSFWKSRQQQ